jgi:2-octaprenyl-6-methoxyphenol hydroxylase
LLSDLLPVDFARGLGLLALDSFAPLRRFVMRQGLTPLGR